ncbi:MAG: hypothetical protein ACE5HE_11365 [Phycisphaerae bacterium]
MRWDDQHKLAHVVLRKMGESTLLVREGLAVYLSQDNLDVDLRSYSRVQSQRGLLPSIMKLIEDAEFQKMGVDVTFPAAGSFIRYLVEEYGMDKVKLLYSQLRPGDPGLKFRKVFNQIFAQRVEEVDVLWQTNSTAQ